MPDDAHPFLRRCLSVRSRLLAPCFKLRERGEGRGVVCLYQAVQRKLCYRARRNGKALCRIVFFKMQRFAAAVRKINRSLCPPAIVRKIGAQRYTQLIHRNGASEIKRPRGLGVAIDAPALIGPFAVRGVLINAVHGIVRSKYRFAVGFPYHPNTVQPRDLALPLNGPNHDRNTVLLPAAKVDGANKAYIAS